MKIKIENFLAIKKADIKLEGITVIAGLNDTGKSTVGKCLFAIVNGLIEYERSVVEAISADINSIINMFAIYSSRNKKNNITYNDAYQNIVKLYKELHIGGGFQNSLLTQIFKREEFVCYIQKNLEFIEEIQNKILQLKDKNMKIAIQPTIGSVSKLLKLNLNDKIKKTLESNFSSIFLKEDKSSINEKSSNICFSSQSKNMSFSITSTIKNFINDITNVINKKITFIESPLVLQKDIFRDYGKLTLFNKPSINKDIYVSDLIGKLLFSSNVNTETDFDQEISNIIKGDISMKGDIERNIVYSKSNGVKAKNNNIATGIKSFGLLQMLNRADVLNSDDILIIDEPEVHLHPEWQMKYARILVYLFERHNCKILLASHSTEMIMAIEETMKEKNLEGFANFYLAKQNKNGESNIVNKNGKIEDIYRELGEPLEDLVFDD